MYYQDNQILSGAWRYPSMWTGPGFSRILRKERNNYIYKDWKTVTFIRMYLIYVVCYLESSSVSPCSLPRPSYIVGHPRLAYVSLDSLSMNKLTMLFLVLPIGMEQVPTNHTVNRFKYFFYGETGISWTGNTVVHIDRKMRFSVCSSFRFKRKLSDCKSWMNVAC